MSSFKIHLFNLKFTFKTLEANCQRASCKVHIFIKIQNQQRKLKQVAQVKKNIATFNSQFIWDEIPIKYDQISGTYLDTPAILSIHYQTSQQGLKANKIKVGQVTVNLAKLLNSKSYRINTQYSLQKCYDSNAKLKMGIDLTQINYNEEHRFQEFGVVDGYKNIKNSSIWKVSKIRQKMNEDEKEMLQNKLYQYQERMQKYRQSNNDQIKRFNQQLERKQQKISTLSAQNISLTQSLQNSQIQLQKTRTRISTLQKQLLTTQQSTRKLNSIKQSQNRELSTLKQQNQELKSRLEQIQQTREKKQQHYKQQLQKYTQRYMQSENGRNRTIFQLQKKLIQELKRKDQHYSDIISKLEQKIHHTGQNYKQVNTKKQKQLVIIHEKCQKLQKERKNLQIILRQQQQSNSQLHGKIVQLNAINSKLQAEVKTAQSQAQISAFSVGNLQKQLQKIKLQMKVHIKTIQQMKFELQLGSKTIEQQQAMLVKLNRSIKMVQQRQYYMQQKYQDELQIKSYNESCIKGSNNQYKNQIKKLELKNKLLQQKINQSETMCQNIQKQKQKLQEQIKNLNKIIFENGYQILRLQNQIKISVQKSQELQFQFKNKNNQYKQLQNKIDLLIIQTNQEVSQYVNTINHLQTKIRQISDKRIQDANQWEQQFNKQNLDKNNMLSYLQSELERLKILEKSLRTNLSEKNQKQLQLEALLSQQHEKCRAFERESTKLKHQLTKINDQKQSLSKEVQKNRIKITQLKNQLYTTRTQKQKEQKRNTRQKQSYLQLVKWIIDRNWSGMGTDRQFVQQASPQIQFQLITYVNNGLDRLYRLWEKNTKIIHQLKTENQKLSEQKVKLKLQKHYEEQFGSQYKQQKGGSQWDQKQVQKIYIKNGPEHFVSFSTSFQSTKIQELKLFNSQLQKEISVKNSQIQSLNQEIFQQKTRNRQLTQENRSLNLEIQQLNSTILKKNMQINNLQSQINERQVDTTIIGSNYMQRSPSSRGLDYKSNIQSKYRQEKQIKQLQSKIQQLTKQNGIKKSKIDLLEHRIKIAGQKLAVQSQKSIKLDYSTKQKQQNIRRVGKQLQEKQDYIDKLIKQMEIANSKINKKDITIQQLRNQVQQNRKISQILSKQLQQNERKLTAKENQLQKQIQFHQSQMMQLNESISIERIQKQKVILQQKSQINSMNITIKQLQKRILSIQNVMEKIKQQNERLYEKNIKYLSDNNILEQQIKDLKYNDKIFKQSHQKICNQYQQQLKIKQFQFQEYKFSTESKILDLEKKIQDSAPIHI